MYLCEFEVRLVYRATSRTARAVTQRNPISKNKQTNKRMREVEGKHLERQRNFLDTDLKERIWDTE